MPKYLVIVTAKRPVQTEIIVDAPDHDQAELKALDLVHKDQKWSLPWDVQEDERVEDPHVEDVTEVDASYWQITEL